MTKTSGLHALINTTPAAGETLTLSGVEIAMRPITVIEIIVLIRRFPCLRGILLGFAAGKEVTKETIVESILTDGPESITAILAIAGGAKGDAAVEAGLMERPDEELEALLDTAIRITMPGGYEDFFARFVRLARALGMVAGEDEKGTDG